MTLAHPLIAAAAAAAVALPILIHLLLRFQRRPVPWAAMRFLLEAYRRRRRRLRLQQILLLAARCALLLIAGLAIARPLADGAGDTRGPRDVYLCIDNSLTSQLRDSASGRTALERSLAAARAQIRALGPGDRAAVITLASPVDPVVIPPTGDRSALLGVLDRIEPADSAADIESALRLVRDAAGSDSAGRVQISVLSEFRAGSLTLDAPPASLFSESAVDTVLLSPPTETPPNTQIQALTPQRAVLLGSDQRTTVRVALRRFGDTAGDSQTTTVRVLIDDTDGNAHEAGRARATWSAGQRELDLFVPVQAPAGSVGSITLTATIDRDLLPGDDTRRVPLGMAPRARVGIVDRAGLGQAGPLSSSRWLALALEPDDSSLIQPTVIDPADIDPASLSSVDVLFVLRPDLLNTEAWGSLAAFVQNGRSVALVPPAGADAHAWAVTAAEAFGYEITLSPQRRVYEEPIGIRQRGENTGELLRLLTGELGELVRPVRVFSALPMTVEPGQGTVLLSLDDGTPWVVRAAPAQRGAGEVVLFGSALSLDWSTLPATPLMVPLTQEIVRQSAGAAARQRVVTAGEAALLPARVDELVGTTETITVTNGVPARPLRRSAVFQARGSRGESLGVVCVVPDPDAGDTTAPNDEDILGWFRSAGVRPWFDGLDQAEREPASPAASAGLGISGVLFLIALGLAVIEAVMANRFSPRQAGGA